MTAAEATILLAEDDPNDVFFMKRAFEKARLLNPLQIVRDGEEVIEYLKGEGKYSERATYPLPAMLLLDLRLPRRSGFEVLQWVRQQAGLKRLAVVALTSSDDGPDINRAYDLGANSYLVKPPNSLALKQMLERLNSYWLVVHQPPESLRPSL